MNPGTRETPGTAGTPGFLGTQGTPGTQELIGATVGNYRIQQYLGAGGMAEVYVAEHTRIDRRVAVKFLLPEWLGSEEAVARFFSEARTTSSIHHPGIVEVMDCAVHSTGRAYIVMELLDGESLADRLGHDPNFGADVRRALEIARDVAAAVGAAHRLGIVHRDLKPDNIFLVRAPAGPTGFQVKVLDFGIAKLLARGDPRVSPVSLTRPGFILGTPGYISPEQYDNAGRVDHRADIYSLGCILFEILAGRAPFIGKTVETLVAHIHKAPPQVRDHRPTVPAAVERLVQRMLGKKPHHRPADMDAVVSEIAILLETLPARRFSPAVNRLALLRGLTHASILRHPGHRLVLQLSLLGALLLSSAALRLTGYRPDRVGATAGPPRGERTPPLSLGVHPDSASRSNAKAASPVDGAQGQRPALPFVLPLRLRPPQTLLGARQTGHPAAPWEPGENVHRFHARSSLSDGAPASVARRPGAKANVARTLRSPVPQAPHGPVRSPLSDEARKL